MPGMTKAGYVPPAPKKESPENKQPAGKQGKKKKHRRVTPAAAASLVVFAVAFAISAVTLHIFAQVEKSADVFSLGLLLDGHPIGGLTAAEGAELLDELTAEKVASWQFAIACQEREYLITGSDVGLFIDKQATLEPMWQTGKTGNMLERYLDMLRAQVEYPNAKPVFCYAMEPVDALLQQIKMDTDRESVSATVSYTPGSSEPFRFTDEQEGYHLDTADLRVQIEESLLALTAGRAEAVPEVIKPSVRRAELESAITLRSRVTMPLAEDEASLANIRIAAGVLNGRRIEPGAVLSFNETVGRRTAEGGYQIAMEPAYGLGAAGVGGGVCQVSTALYRAALLGGADVVERSAAVRPVAYCDMGQEAAVSDQGIDLVMQNPTNSPMFITTRIYPSEDECTMLEVQLIGLPLEARYALNSVVTETELIEEPVFMLDKTGEYAVYADERVPGSDAQPGYSVVVERTEIREGASTVTQVISQDVYEAIAPVIYVGALPRE